MNEELLRVSVIIPTYNRKSSLLETLRSITNQTFPMNRFEVIIVDDGSTDGTELSIRQSYPFDLQFLSQPNRGSAVARNNGAKNSRGDLLIFIDDDMLLEPDYISGLFEGHKSYSRSIGMGSMLSYTPQNATQFAKIYAHDQFSIPFTKECGFVRFTECVTNNLSIKHDDFFEIGMMQDICGDGPTWWGDVDFGFRAFRMGFGFWRSNKAKCTHQDYSFRDLSTASQRAFLVSKMAVKLFQKYPDLLPYLPMFLDKTPISVSKDSPYLIGRKFTRQIIATRPITISMEKVASLLEKQYPVPYLLEPLYRWIIGSYIHQGYRAGLRKYGNLKIQKL